MPSKRIRQVNDLLQDELGPILAQEIDIPAHTFVTITAVQTSADLSYADISISVLPAKNEATTQKAIQRQAKSIRHAVAQKVVLRKIPLLRFHIDQSEQEAAHIEELIDKIHEEG